MNKYLKWSIIAAVVVAAAIPVLWKASRQSSQAKVFKIGAVLPLSGPLAFMGEGTLNGMLLAGEYANAGKLGVMPFKTVIIAEDGAGAPKTSKSAFEKLVGSDKCLAVVSILSGVCMTLKPLADQNKVVLFANASHPALTRGTEFVLRHSNSAEAEAGVIAQSIADESGSKAAAILSSNDDYGQAFSSEMAARLNAINAPVKLNVKYEVENLDERTLAQKVIAAKPDKVIIVGAGKPLGLIIKRLREYKYAGEIYTSMGFVLLPGAVEAAGKHASGIKHTEMMFDRTSADYVSTAADYKLRFNQEMGAEALIAFNTVKLLCEAGAKNGTNPETLVKNIKQSGEVQGVGEKMTITLQGDILPQLKVVQYNLPEGR